MNEFFERVMEAQREALKNQIAANTILINEKLAKVKPFILDAMQKAEIIPNDSQKYICGLFDEFKQADKDYVKVEIIELPLKIEPALKGL